MPKITELLAYVADEGDGNEGVTAFRSGDSWMPMVGADADRMASLRGMALTLARASGKPITLCRFSLREEIDVIEP